MCNRPIHFKKNSNKKCPKCGNPMEWIEGLLDSDGGVDITVGRYACKHCKIHFKQAISRLVKKGYKLEQNSKNFHWRNITHLPIAVQIGILRKQQFKI